MNEIRIDAPEAGGWVLAQIGGVFAPGWDHSFTIHDGSEILGGFALCQYLGSSMTVHAGGKGVRWCSRELLWMVFHYAFEQVGCRILIAPVKSTNHKALAINLRAGWQLHTTIPGAFEDADLVVLTMTKPACRWLKYEPKMWKPGVSKVAAYG